MNCARPGVRDRQRALAVVVQDVDAQRKIPTPADLAGDGRHVGYDVGRDPAGIERDVAEVFEHQAVHTAAGQGFGIFQDVASDGSRVSPSRRTGHGGRCSMPMTGVRTFDHWASKGIISLRHNTSACPTEARTSRRRRQWTP